MDGYRRLGNCVRRRKPEVRPHRFVDGWARVDSPAVEHQQAFKVALLDLVHIERLRDVLLAADANHDHAATVEATPGNRVGHLAAHVERRLRLLESARGVRLVVLAVPI